MPSNVILLLGYTIICLLENAMSQINLGSFFLHPTGPNGFDLGMGQAANIFGFGGDRSFKLAGNPAGFSLGSNNGALIGSERVGVDGGIGAGREGVEMGSQVQFGNNPNPMHPAGQLGGFMENVKNFFEFLKNGMPMPNTQPPPFAVPRVRTTTHATLIKPSREDEDEEKEIMETTEQSVGRIEETKKHKEMVPEKSSESPDNSFNEDEITEAFFTAKTEIGA